MLQDEGLLDELLDGAEELALLVARVLLAADVGLLVVLAHLAALAHLLHAGTHLHSINIIILTQLILNNNGEEGSNWTTMMDYKYWESGLKYDRFLSDLMCKLYI